MPAMAEDFSLGLPIDCVLGQDCYIQNYVDHAPGPEASDFTCGPLTNDTHKGTDIGLLNLAAMRRGVAVLAAAPGVVTGTRDGVPDISIRDPAAPDFRGRECGNGVVLRHPGGWETQYCHMKQGSIRVKNGQVVHRGESLGMVGLSGQTEFPHVHLSVRKNATVVDPFAAEFAQNCGAEQHQLWADPVAYVPGGLLTLGFSENLPRFADIRDRDIAQTTLGADAPALVLWGNFFGGRKGDRVEITIDGPAGFRFRKVLTLERKQAIFFRASGKKRPPGGWPEGRYDGRISLIRGDAVLSTKTSLVTITSR